jgi:molybdenum cofactor cytidylyltransferase
MTSAIVLAAGLSTRMKGEPKALLRIDDRDTFVTRIARTFNEAGIDDVVVVVGHEGARVAAVVGQSDLSVRTVVNPLYAAGQFSSLLAGLDAVERPDLEAVLLALVDAPLFSASTVKALVQRFKDTHAPVVRAVRGDQHGHPVLIGRSLLEAVRRSDPGQGAKPVVRAHASLEGDVPVDDRGAFIDIDTPADYAKLLDASGHIAV